MAAEPPPVLKLPSGTGPVSHIRVPLGCATRKHGADIMGVARSSFFSRYGDVSGMSSVPQSITYRRRDFGGSALRCCAIAETASNAPSIETRIETGIRGFFMELLHCNRIITMKV